MLGRGWILLAQNFATTPLTQNSIVIILLIVKKNENVSHMLAAMEHNFR